MLNRLGMVGQTTSALWRQFVVSLAYRVSFWTTRAAQKKLGLERKEGRKEGKGKKVIVSNHPYPPLRMGSVRMILEKALALFLLSSHLLHRGKRSLILGLPEGDSMFPLCSILPHSTQAFSSVLGAVSVTICQL